MNKPKPPGKQAKPPTPRYHYKLATVEGSREASRMETSLRERLRGLGLGLGFFAIGHEGGSYDVMGDSGMCALADADLRAVRAAVAELGA
jgi:hypothetical protein